MEKFCLVADCKPRVDLVGCVFYILYSRSFPCIWCQAYLPLFFVLGACWGPEGAAC